MKKLNTILMALIMTALFGADLLAQTPQQVTVRDLNSYANALTSQTDLRDHPLAVLVSSQTPEDKYVTFDAIVVSYPKNSGLASIVQATGVPGRIHVFVTDVSAATMGPEGMSIQIVVDGARRETLEALGRGDVIRVAGFLRFFNNVSQFDATDVTFLSFYQDDEEYENLGDLLEPSVIPLTEVNKSSTTSPGTHRWVADNYSKHINRYVKFEGLEVIDVLENNTGRPRMVLSDGETIIYMYDTSLRFRNDRGNGYAYNPTTEVGLGYNWRRLGANLDGPFVPPPTGSIVDISGYILIDTFDPLGLNEATAQSAFKIVPWDDGILWTEDGTDDTYRLTDWRNDLVVVGFAPIIDNVALNPTTVTGGADVSISANILKPEADYTLESVKITYSSRKYDEDTSSEAVTADMTAGSGDSYSFNFGSFETFTTVNYTISVVAKTPGGVETRGTRQGSFYASSATVTAPPQFSQPAGTYQNSVSVTLSSQTSGATIYYTTDGSDPDETSNIYAGSPLNFTATTTLKAKAQSGTLEDSPIVTKVYTIEVAATEVATLRAFRQAPQTETYRFTGEAVVTFTRTARNAKFIMDETGGMLIDDFSGVITEPYVIGDKIGGMLGTHTLFSGLLQFVPQSNPGAPLGTGPVVPKVTTLADLNILDHESALVEIKNARFVSTGTFSGSANYQITDPSLGEGTTVIFRTGFAESDYIGQAIPEAPMNLTALVGNFNGTLQLTSRNLADFDFDVSAERHDQPLEFRLSQNYPNPFNPSTWISYNIAENATVNLVVYDILGRRVATLVNNQLQSPGTYSVNFDATQLSSGTYIYRLEAGNFVSVKKMMLIK